MVRKSTSPPGRLRRVDFVDHADIGMAHFERAFEFRRKGAAESEFGGLDADALAALAIERLVDHAHAALTHFADDFEAAGDYLAGVKGPVHFGTGDQRFAQEAAHALFPIDGFGDFLEEFRVAPAFVLQERAALGRGPLEGGREKAHHALVLVGAVFHWPTLNRSNSHFRARYHSRWKVCRERPSASAASSSFMPRKNFISTTLQRLARFDGEFLQQGIHRDGHLQIAVSGENAWRQSFDREEVARRAGARVIDQTAAHDAGGNDKEMAAILPIDVLGSRQPQESLVDQSSGLQRVPGTLAPEIAGGDAMQIGHQQFEQARFGVAIPGLPLVQQPR